MFFFPLLSFLLFFFFLWMDRPDKISALFKLKDLTKKLPKKEILTQKFEIHYWHWHFPWMMGLDQENSRRCLSPWAPSTKKKGQKYTPHTHTHTHESVRLPNSVMENSVLFNMITKRLWKKRSLLLSLLFSSHFWEVYVSEPTWCLKYSFPAFLFPRVGIESYCGLKISKYSFNLKKRQFQRKHKFLGKLCEAKFFISNF